MFNYKHYVPVLKWKMGEYQALARLDDKVKDALTPLFEIPPVGFDFEKGQQRESIDAHLGDFAKRLKSKWQSRPCFVDLKYIPAATRCDKGQHCVDYIFSTARDEGCAAIPVVSFQSDTAFLSEVAKVVKADKRGVCLRLVPTDFDRPKFASDIEDLLRKLGLGWGDADLIIDFGAYNYLPIAIFTRTLKMMLDMVPALNRWRTFTVVGTSYPQSVAGLDEPFELLPRREWEAYKAFIGGLEKEARIPTFGDYAVAHPDLVELDMRMIKPFAKMRYTTSKDWYIARGTPVRTEGFGQYKKLCSDLVAQPFTDAAKFSDGDAYIRECAKGKATTGNLSTWVWVATNRHLSKVVFDLAILHGL